MTRSRLRDLGIVVGELPTGPHNAITDVDALRALHAAAKHAGAPAATLAHIVARGTALASPATTQDEEATA